MDVEQGLALFQQRRLHGPVAVQPAVVEGLHIGAQTLMQPHVVGVDVGQLVAEPFVRQLVMQQPVEAAPVQSVAVAVGIDGLVLHAQVRGRDHAHLLVPEGVGADRRLVKVQHARKFIEQGPGPVGVVGGQVPVDHRHGIAVAAGVVGAERDIGSDVEGHGIGVGPRRAPAPGGPAVALVDDAGEATVRRGRQAGRDGDVQVDAVRLGQRMVDTGPEQVAALALDGGGDPRPPVRGRRPDEAAVPRRVRGHPGPTGIGDAKVDRLTGGEGARQVDGQVPVGIGPVSGGNRHPVDRDGGDVEHRVQLDRQLRHRGGGGKAEPGHGAEGAGLGTDAERQVGMVEAQRQLGGGARLVGLEGEGGGDARPGRRRRGRGTAGQGQGGDCGRGKSGDGGGHDELRR